MTRKATAAARSRACKSRLFALVEGGGCEILSPFLSRHGPCRMLDCAAAFDASGRCVRVTWGDRPYDRYGRHARAERDRLLLPEPYWLADEGGWVKSLLLFFDEIAILLPEYMRGRHVIAEPTLAGPIEDLGLLRVIDSTSA